LKGLKTATKKKKEEEEEEDNDFIEGGWKIIK